MKSREKLIIGFALLFIFSCNQFNAQKSNLPKLLIGEWTKLDQSGPRINDTITLSKNLIESSELHPRWKFVLPNKLIQQYSTYSNNGSTEVISMGQSFKCNYDKNSKFLRITGSEYDAYFKIVSRGKQTINLICVK